MEKMWKTCKKPQKSLKNWIKGTKSQKKKKQKTKEKEKVRKTNKLV